MAKNNFNKNPRDTYNHAGTKEKSYKSQIKNCYNKGYVSGWDNYDEDTPFGSRMMGAIGYSKGFKAHKKQVRTNKKLQVRRKGI